MYRKGRTWAGMGELGREGANFWSGKGRTGAALGEDRVDTGLSTAGRNEMKCEPSVVHIPWLECFDTHLEFMDTL